MALVHHHRVHNVRNDHQPTCSDLRWPWSTQSRKITIIVIVIATIIINHLFSEVSPMAVVRAGKTRLEVTVAHVAHISCRFKWSINQQVSWMYNMMLLSTTYKIRHVLPMLVTLGMLEEVVPLEWRWTLPRDPLVTGSWFKLTCEKKVKERRQWEYNLSDCRHIFVFWQVVVFFSK